MSEPFALPERRRPLPVQLQQEHPEWVKELAFTCWLEADRNASRALALLTEHWPEKEPQRLPPYRTVAAWAKRHNWEARADAAIAQAFPGLTMRHTARLVHLAGLALTTLEQVISGDGFARDAEGNIRFDRNGEAIVIDPRHQRNRLDGAVKALELAGVGTAGSRDRRAPVVRPAASDSVDLDAMSLPELLRYEAELVAKSRSTLAEDRAR